MQLLQADDKFYQIDQHQLCCEKSSKLFPLNSHESLQDQVECLYCLDKVYFNKLNIHEILCPTKKLKDKAQKRKQPQKQIYQISSKKQLSKKQLATQRLNKNDTEFKFYKKIEPNQIQNLKTQHEEKLKINFKVSGKKIEDYRAEREKKSSPKHQIEKKVCQKPENKQGKINPPFYEPEKYKKLEVEKPVQAPQLSFKQEKLIEPKCKASLEYQKNNAKIETKPLEIKPNRIVQSKKDPFRQPVNIYKNDSQQRIQQPRIAPENRLNYGIYRYNHNQRINVPQICIPPEIQKKSLTQTKIQRLPRCTYEGNQDTDETMCLICYVDFKQNEDLVKFQACNHIYHHECVAQWLRKDVRCPKCRQEVIVPPKKT